MAFSKPVVVFLVILVCGLLSSSVFARTISDGLLSGIWKGADGFGKGVEGFMNGVVKKGKDCVGDSSKCYQVYQSGQSATNLVPPSPW